MSSNKLYNQCLGIYTPSFFYSIIDSTLDPSGFESFPVNKTEKIKSVFCHEYIHFLQDMTTTYGLINICRQVDVIKLMSCLILKEKGEKEFVVPVDIGCDDVAALNRDLFSIYMGSAPDFFVGDIKKIKLSEEIEDFPDVGSVKNIIVDCWTDDNLENKKTFWFGAACINESMAHLIEESIYGKLFVVEKYPYKTAELVAAQIYPEFVEDVKMLICLCDISLNTFSPGEFFCDILGKVKNSTIKPKTPLELYDFVNSYNFPWGGTNYKIDSLMYHFSGIAEKQLIDYFTESSVFSQLIIWIRNKMESSRALRKKDFFFWGSILEKTISKREYMFYSEIVHKIGMPIIIDDKNRYYFPTPMKDHDQLPHLIAIENILMFFLKGETMKPCMLKNFCMQTPDLTNSNCDNYPWNNSENGCYYGNIWKMWTLHRKIPKIIN